MRVVWSPTALHQIKSIFDYVVVFNPEAANHLAASLIAAGEGLSQFPHRGRRVPNAELRELVTIHPYIIRYRITRDTVRILRVRHASRRPSKQ